MPPKPFNPPRPSGSSKPTAKGPRKSTSKTNSAVAKSKPKPKPKSIPNRRRISSPRPPHLPSLSPDPSASELSQDDEDEGTNSRSEQEPDSEAEAESNHHSDSSSLPSQPALPKNPPPRRRKSQNQTAAVVDVPSSSALDAPTSNKAQDSEAILSSRAEHIPAPLLSALLHTFLAEQGHAGTRIKKDANAAVGKYVDTFVREAIARAAWVRGGGGDGEGGADGDGFGGGGGDRAFLEVEDLERLAPQLLMDF